MKHLASICQATSRAVCTGVGFPLIARKASMQPRWQWRPRRPRQQQQQQHEVTPATADCSLAISNPFSRRLSTTFSMNNKKPSELVLLSRKFNLFYYGGYKAHACTPLFCQGIQIGLVRPEVEEKMLRFPQLFDFSKRGRINICDDLDTFDKRTEAVDAALRKLRTETDFVALQGWRDEFYDVKGPDFAARPLFKMERAATCMFGIHQYGVDINGYVNHPELGLCLWMQRRAKTKPTWPGMLDNFVAGGLSCGFGILETAVKEAEEEANVQKDVAETMRPAGTVTFFFESARGIFPQTEFVFDLEVPPEFVPGNNDGEVDGFELVPIKEVVGRLCASDMKTTAAPTAVDFLVRRGIISADNEPNFAELVANLHIPLHNVYD